MDDNQRELRRAQIAELQLALRAALEKLDQLEKRIAARKPLECNPIAAHVAIGMTKARNDRP
jgi:hypothetical protein